MKQLKFYLTKLEKTLDLYLVDKAPPIPETWQRLIVLILPWLTITFFVLSLPIVLALFGMGAAISPFVVFTGNAAYSITYAFGLIILALSIIIMALSIPGLFKRQRIAWKLLFYSTLVNFLYSILSNNVFGGVISTVISLYLLFQIKHHYK